MTTVDETHDPQLRSWVESANEPDSDFPIQNLPFGVYRSRAAGSEWRGGVAIGDQVFDLAAVDAQTGPTLNPLAAAGRSTWRDLRQRLSHALSDRGQSAKLERYLTSLSDVELGLPVAVGDYTDFYSSYFHAYHAGQLFRPDDPLTPNFKWIPIGYHARSSSIVPSGTSVHRPSGQQAPEDDGPPAFGPSKALDYEVELGLVVGPGNARGNPIPIDRAEDHLFGVVLLNDWSARDVQAWEYQPLGPFLSKSFATTLSPWVVTLEALAPFRAPAFARPQGDPEPLPYLADAQNERQGHFDIQVEAWIRTAGAARPHRLSHTSYATNYWTAAQLLTHHTSNGCPLEPGDLLGTGTVSGPNPEEAGTLLELSKAGASPVMLPDGAKRGFLEDGDELVLRARCSADGHRGIGFGEARGTVTATVAP